jgi:hypothetical protein
MPIHPQYIVARCPSYQCIIARCPSTQHIFSTLDMYLVGCLSTQHIFSILDIYLLGCLPTRHIFPILDIYWINFFDIFYDVGASTDTVTTPRLITASQHHSPHPCPRCRMLPALPPRLHPTQISIQFSPQLSKLIRRRQEKTLLHIHWQPNFNPAIPLMRFSPFFGTKSLHVINLRVPTNDSQSGSFRQSMSSMRFPMPWAKALA